MRVTRDQLYANRDQLRQQRAEAGTDRRARIRDDDVLAPAQPARGGSMAGATGLAGPPGGTRPAHAPRPTRSAVSTAGGIDLRPTGAEEQARMIVARLEGFLGDRLANVEAAAVAIEARIEAAEERMAALRARASKLDAEATEVSACQPAIAEPVADAAALAAALPPSDEAAP